MAQTTAYAFADVICTLNQRQVLGFWEGDDCVAISESEDAGQGVVGADGSSIFSQFAGKGAQISLKLQHTSATHRYLTDLLQAQREGSLDGIPFTVQERRSGEGGSADRCFILQAPALNKGKAADVREWVLWTGSFDRTPLNV
jgi:hypothetical protein